MHIIFAHSMDVILEGFCLMALKPSEFRTVWATGRKICRKEKTMPQLRFEPAIAGIGNC